MSSAQPAPSAPLGRSVASDLVAALVGGRRAGRVQGMAVTRRRRRANDPTADAPRSTTVDTPGSSGGTTAPQEGPSGSPAGTTSGVDDAAPRTGGLQAATGARGAEGAPPVAPDPDARGPRPDKASRGAGRVPERRRAVEAGMIGLGDAEAGELPWWGPCWERGLDGGTDPDRLFDELRDFRREVRVLHGLRVAGTASAIDHVLVGPGGVVVADTETCPGKVRTDGVHLRVRGRDRSPMVDVALWQAEVVRATLERRGIRDVPVHGVLHWQHVEGLGTKAVCLRGVPLLSAGATMGLAAVGTEVSPLAVERIAAALEPACTRH